ncbi:MAG: hypothetical protein MK105_00345 [Crocinitomicaceae bacterium]|nr:hypothetical protein [Crocinitomicaceae bacterium]
MEYPKDQYIEHLDQLGRRLHDFHPNTPKFIYRTDFWNLIKKASIKESRTYGEFNN